MTQGPAELDVAVALLLPAVVTALSYAMSPSGFGDDPRRESVPAAAVVVATMFAPKSSRSQR